MNHDYTNWALSAREIRMDWDYSELEWANDVLKAVNDGKSMDARLVAEAWRIVGTNDDNVTGLKDLLRAINQVAYSRLMADERIVEKYTVRYTVIDFRLRPWLETTRVDDAHIQHWNDVQEVLGSFRKAG